MNTKYEWFGLYSAAVLETDWSKMEERLQAAESAIKARLHEFSLNHGGSPEENEAIRDCVGKLEVLRADVANWHSSKNGI
jgi:hypothetical protein